MRNVLTKDLPEETPAVLHLLPQAEAATRAEEAVVNGCVCGCTACSFSCTRPATEEDLTLDYSVFLQ